MDRCQADRYIPRTFQSEDKNSGPGWNQGPEIFSDCCFYKKRWDANIEEQRDLNFAASQGTRKLEK